MTVNIAQVGLGYWGPNLARNLNTVPGAKLHTICDASSERLDKFAAQYSGARLQSDFQAVLDDPQVHAIVLATPVHTHFPLAKRALQSGKHILVEKPLAQTSDQCRELVDLAEKHSRILMAGHVFVFNSAVRKVKEYIDSGLLGDVHYIYSQRLNLGIIRQDVNALWNFAPHDLSIVNYWLGARPEAVMARGYSYVQPNIEDVVFMTLDYPGGVGVNVHISWLDPHKVRRMTVVGSKKMVVYDDVSTDARLLVYDKGVTRKSPEAPATANTSLGEFQTYAEFQLLLRSGDVLIPKLDFAEPLQMECRHFVESIENGKALFADGREGLKVVEALEAAQKSLDLQGQRVPVG